MLIKNLCKNLQNCGLVLIYSAFLINVEKYRFGRYGNATLDLRKKHRIVKLVFKVFKCSLSVNNFVGKQIWKHFQKVRFTASEKARYPDTDFIGPVIKRLFVIIKKCIIMTAKLFGNNIFRKLLLDYFIVILINLNNAVNISVYVRFINLL